MLKVLNTLRKKLRNDRGPRGTQPRLEQLEERLVPYATSGDAWPMPQRITISFVPDGTLLGYNGSGQAITSTLFHDFASLGSSSTWEKQILKAAATWAEQTNVNISLVSDDGSAIGSGNYEEGNPNFGDIRIAGYQGGAGSGQPLASAYMPPPGNNYSVAGDITFNTSQPFNIGSTYDLFTVAEHEIGHALGMLHSSNPSAVMYAGYNGTMTGLSTDDAAGVQSIYSNGNARTVTSVGNSFSTATGITVSASTDTALVTGLALATPGATNMFSFTAPSGSASSMTVTVQSAGLSLLAPKLYVYNASQQQIGYVSGANQFGATLTVTINNISAGQLYYVKVVGAETDALGTGAYALAINTGSGAAPTVPIPNAQVAAGATHQSYSGQAQGGYSGLLAPVEGLLGDLRPLLGPLGGVVGGLLGFVGDIAELPNGAHAVRPTGHPPGCTCPLCRGMMLSNGGMVDTLYAGPAPTQQVQAGPAAPAAAAAKAPPTPEQTTPVVVVAPNAAAIIAASTQPAPVPNGSPAAPPTANQPVPTPNVVPAPDPGAGGQTELASSWLSDGQSQSDACFADAVWDTAGAADGVDVGGW